MTENTIYKWQVKHVWNGEENVAKFTDYKSAFDYAVKYHTIPLKIFESSSNDDGPFYMEITDK